MRKIVNSKQKVESRERMFLIAVAFRLPQHMWQEQTKFQGMRKVFRNVAYPSGCEIVSKESRLM